MATYELGKIGMNLRGAYDASVDYSILDVVTYNGSSYAALQPSTGMPVTDTDYWQQICVSGAGSFSANETATGSTWIDGKPIYRRVFNVDFDTPYTGTDYLVGTIQSMDKLVQASGSFSNSNGIFVLAYSQDQWNGYLIAGTGGDIHLNLSSNFNLYNITVIVEYTKTTD